MKYIKLDEAPEFVLNFPECSACMVDLQCDDGWCCPQCGTYWGIRANDGDVGELYESWSGDVLDSDPVTHHEAMQISVRREFERRQKFLRGPR